MRTVKLFIAALFVVALGATSFAQTQDQSKVVATKTESFTVSGKCGMCKTRIEKAAKVEGVSKATWDKETKMLTVVYNPSTVKIDDLQKKIAAAGHDTEKYKADAKVYDALPGCCKYR